MNEYEIAINKVLPYLNDELGWPNQLISSYGRVPVQIGSSTIWADFVCYYSHGNKAVPWLLIEVKKEGIDLQTAIPQAESYSLILGAAFFCVTNGLEYNYFFTGQSQDKNIPIICMPLPKEDYLVTGVEFISFPSNIDSLVDLFLIGLNVESKFLEDTKNHCAKLREINKRIFKRLDCITPDELKYAIENFLILKKPNKDLMVNNIDNDFVYVKNIFQYILKSKDDPIIKIQNLLKGKKELHISGAGIFVITQLLASAFPDEYVVLEENISKCLRFLGLTDVLVTTDTANGYLYINEICKKLYNDKIKNKLQIDFGLVSVHNFLWHYYTQYKNCKKWCP